MQNSRGKQPGSLHHAGKHTTFQWGKHYRNANPLEIATNAINKYV